LAAAVIDDTDPAPAWEIVEQTSSSFQSLSNNPNATIVHSTSTWILLFQFRRRKGQGMSKMISSMILKLMLLFLLCLVVLTHSVSGFKPVHSSHQRFVTVHGNKPVRVIVQLHVVAPEKESTTAGRNAEETTEKYGLEVGLFESMKQKDGGESAKSLLKKYGIAYLATSVPLAIVSFAICYVLVENGVDVGALLAKIGIESAASEKAGTFAIAYAAHKAASPIRFPPTVVLTPIVAKLIGKEPEAEETQTVVEDGEPY
jgi:Protein of unknown function (DUF1279)